MLFQHRWTYIQRTVDVDKEAYEPLEGTIKSHFLETAFRWNDTSSTLRQIAAVPIRKGGLGINNPVQSATSKYSVSKSACKCLIEAIHGEQPWQPIQHHRHFTSTTSQHKQAINTVQSATAKNIKADAPPHLKKAFSRASEFSTGHCLLQKPVIRTGSTLTAHEVWDYVDLRYARKPPDLPR
jgi:hypothetical protein